MNFSYVLRMYVQQNINHIKEPSSYVYDKWLSSGILKNFLDGNLFQASRVRGWLG